MKRAIEIIAVTVVALFLVAAFAPELSGGTLSDEGTSSRAYVIENGFAETGAVNLVTAIYLGYRAFDTLGETVVLMLAVTGVTFLVERARK